MNINTDEVSQEYVMSKFASERDLRAAMIAEIVKLRAQIAATQPPQDERGWRDLFWSVARALNCLPSTFVDGNAHVYKQAEKYASLAAAQPVALSTLTAWIEEALSYVGSDAWSPSLERQGRSLLVKFAASAPAQQAGQGEPIGWLKPNESYAPNAFRWERTDTHTRPIFATSPHPMEEEMATLREALEAIMGYPEINSYLGRQIFNLARAALAGSKG